MNFVFDKVHKSQNKWLHIKGNHDLNQIKIQKSSIKFDGT